MKCLAILVALTVSPATIAAEPVSASTSMTGRFNYIDTTQPGCGIFAIASKAVFVTEDSGKRVEIAIPCLEMQSVENSARESTPIRIGERYKIAVSHQKPSPDINSPFLLNRNPWYLVGIEQ